MQRGTRGEAELGRCEIFLDNRVLCQGCCQSPFTTSNKPSARSHHWQLSAYAPSPNLRMDSGHPMTLYHASFRVATDLKS